MSAIEDARAALARHESQNSGDPFRFPLENHMYVALRALVDHATSECEHGEPVGGCPFTACANHGEPSVTGDCSQCGAPLEEHHCAPIPSCIHRPVLTQDEIEWLLRVVRMVRHETEHPTAGAALEAARNAS